MPKKIIIVIGAAMFINASAATVPPKMHIDSRSENRTLCHLTFDAVEGLSVDGKLAPPSSYHSRANNERYAACPYDVEIKYEGQVMRVDFGTGFDLDSVKKYRHSNPVDSGFFAFDGQEWQGATDTRPAENDLRVTDEADSMLVSGFLSRSDPASGARDYCYAITVVYESGYATGGTCSPKKERLKSWQKLLEKRFIRYQP